MMALDQEYFDSIQIDVVKRKYYNANKVNAVFSDIQVQAAELIEENEALKAALMKQKDESTKSGELLDSIQKLYRETLTKAHERADAIISEAEERSRTITHEALEHREKAEKVLRICIDRMRSREEQNIDFLNAQLQDFLSEVNSCDGCQDHDTDKSEPADPVGKTGESGSEKELSDLEHIIGHMTQEIRELENTGYTLPM